MQCASTLFVQGHQGGMHLIITLQQSQIYFYWRIAHSHTFELVLLLLLMQCCWVFILLHPLVPVQHDTFKKINYGIGMRTFRLTLPELWFDQWWKHTTYVSELHKFDFFLAIDSFCDVLVLIAVCSFTPCRMLNYITKKGASSAQTLGIVGTPSISVAELW